MHLSTENSLLVAWLLSAVMSSMPQPSENAPYLVLWLHNIAQFVAANPYRMVKPSPTHPAGPAQV
jgi:hypothetical protein